MYKYLIIVCLSVFEVRSFCPETELIHPCVCKDGIYNTITCGGNSDIDLTKIFEKLGKSLNETEKHFYEFHLNNTAINELKDNTFNGITFDDIFISKCNNLTKINKNAFNGTDLVTKYITIQDNPQLSSPDNSIFATFTKFVNLEEFNLLRNNLTEIPSDAFKSTTNYQDKLFQLSIGGPSFKKIGNNAFSSLRGLDYLVIDSTSLDSIPENAFAFDQDSNRTLTLSFTNNAKLNTNSFNENALSHLKRPCKLRLVTDGKQFELLDEKIILKFLNINDKNKIVLNFQKINCDSCTNFWLLKHPDQLNRLEDWKCSNGNKLSNISNFGECRSYDNLKPCRFVRNEMSISCAGNTALDNLKTILYRFSKELKSNSTERHFNRFYLNNTSVKVLEENTFNDLTFDEIIIENCTQLTTIHRNAFTATNLVTKKFKLNSNPKLVSPDNSIFEILSRFTTIDEIILGFNGFTEIPFNAFRPLNGYQNNLTRLSLWGNFTKLGASAFSSLTNLTLISFNQAQFNAISPNAFELEDFSNDILELDFTKSPMINNSVFAEKSLINTRRPMKLVFGSPSSPKQMTYLDEKVFLAFLLDNQKNSIELRNQLFDCNDCRNYWLKKQQNLIQRILSVKCSNGKQFGNPDNFKNCDSLIQEVSP